MEQVKAEPVAWMYRFEQREPVLMPTKQGWADSHHKWTETPLYATPQPAAVDGVVEQVSDMMREVFISGADWGRTRPGHFSDYLATAIKPHLEALAQAIWDQADA